MRRIGRTAIALVSLVVGLLVSSNGFQTADRLPDQLTDEAFWNLISDASETGGTFGSENFVSNERSFQHIVDELSTRQPASAYIGVGPEQNFTYILALKPRIAFVVDIRRQNLVQHLMYKAMFELSADRADFLSRLFSRARPDHLGSDATIETLFDGFNAVPADELRFIDGFQEIRTHLTTTHGFALTNADETSLLRVMRAFAFAGPNLTYNGPRVFPGGVFPSFEEIMRETDSAGAHRSFLASEPNFHVIKDLQKRNLLVPIVGDFSGTKALKAVGQYVRSHNATVTSFYTSNVEQYLFMSAAWNGFYANVATLPVNGKSVFIRGLIRSASGDYSASPQLPPTSRYETVLFPIADLVATFEKGSIQTYHDILVR